MRCIPVLLCVALGGLVPAAEPVLPGPPADPNAPVCTVNGERILRQDVEDRMPPVIVGKLVDLRRRLIAMGRSETDAQETVEALHLPVFRQTLRDLVRERLLVQEAQRRKLQVSDLLASEAFEREWEALKARELAGTPGYEQKAVRERIRTRLLLQAFRRQDEVRRDEDAWFREALKRSEVFDGGPGGALIPMRFFFPNDRLEKASGGAEPEQRAPEAPAERP